MARRRLGPVALPGDPRRPHAAGGRPTPWDAYPRRSAAGRIGGRQRREGSWLLYQPPPEALCSPVGRGETPVCEAAAGGHTDVVAALLDAGTPARQQCADGQPLVSLAAGPAGVQLVDLLAARGADLDARNRMGNTPLIIASAQGRRDVVETLLRHGADPDLRGDQRRTALMAAAAAGRIEVVRGLVAAGVRTGTRDEEGRTAETIARARGHTEIAEHLEQSRDGGILSGF
ncbi:MAG: ankyrin repeat domain-containing protein [Acidobacteriota bacterium]|nr:ankyrin repeat domain-containing protein [Acidobacteriota bacterium]